MRETDKTEWKKGHMFGKSSNWMLAKIQERQKRRKRWDAREIRETKFQIEKLLKPLKQIRFVFFDEGDVYGQPREPFLEFVGRGIFS